VPRKGLGRRKSCLILSNINMKLSLNLFVPESISGAVCNTSRINCRIKIFIQSFTKEKQKWEVKSEHGCTRMTIIGRHLSCVCRELNPASCNAVCASFGAKEFVQTDLLSKVIWLDVTVTPERSVVVVGWLTDLEINYLSLSIYRSFGWYLFARKVKFESLVNYHNRSKIFCF
jgi:hypothetical protein